MAETLEITLRAFLAACGAGMLTFIVFSIKWLIKRIKVDDMTIKALAHDAYFRHCRYLMPYDEIPEEDLENHNHLYKAYHAQGLNGTGDRMHELILEKKVIIRPTGGLETNAHKEAHCDQRAYIDKAKGEGDRQCV